VVGERWSSTRIARPFPALPLQLRGEPGDRVVGLFPRDLLAVEERRGAPVGIVEIEDDRLLERVGRPLALGVARVALDLRGPPLVALDEEADGGAGPRDARRVVGRSAGDQILGHVGVGEDLLLGAAAAGEPREREARAHEGHEAPAIDALGGLVLAVDELARLLGAEGEIADAIFGRAPVVVAEGVGQRVGLLARRDGKALHRWHPEQCCGGTG
jgi:hypothetical protein